MTKKEKKKYQVRETACYDRKCFVPFEDNGIKICRLYETGKCPKKYTEDKMKLMTNIKLRTEKAKLQRKLDLAMAAIHYQDVEISQYDSIIEDYKKRLQNLLKYNKELLDDQKKKKESKV